LTQDELNALVAAAVNAYDNLVRNDETDPEPGNGDDGKGEAVDPGTGSEDNTDKDKELGDKVSSPNESDDDDSNGSDEGSDDESGDGSGDEQTADGDDESSDGDAVSATDITDDSSDASTLTQTGDAAATTAAGAGIFGLLAAAFAALASRRRSSVE
jgi:hypothetical protein